jgi:hypothetical protein
MKKLSVVLLVFALTLIMDIQAEASSSISFTDTIVGVDGPYEPPPGLRVTML